MATTTSNRSAKAPRVALRQSIARYAAGEFSKRDIEKVFASALDHDSSCGEVIREYLDQQVHERALSRSIRKDLLEVLARHLPEDVPTETAEHVQDAAAAKPAEHVQDVAAAKPADRQLAVGTVLRERFRLDEAVASGSMGLVFRATDLLKLEAGALSPVIAIKVINPEFSNDAAALRSFQNEVANTQHLSHPNIIRLFELDKDQGHYFITMEWLEGESLDALLDRSRGSALPPVQAYAIIEQLCDALIYAHGRQVIHADIKPGNVFLTKPGELKLIDFGIARIHNPHDSGDGKGQESVALTPAYASCECLEHQTATEQDDLFSLACLIYRLLSGRRVFGTRTALQAEAERLEPVAIGGMSARRWQALRKALAYRRAGRQSDVRSFADEFGQRSEPRGRIAPEPDDAQFTATTTLGDDVAAADDANLHDTGSLRALNFPIELDDDPPHPVAGRADSGARAQADSAAQRLEIELELSDVMEGSGVLELPEPINFFDDADCDDSVFVPVEESSGRFAVDTLTPLDNAAPTETRLATESTVPTETRVPTESTVPSGKSRSGTIEIEILKEMPLPVPAAVAPPATNSFSLLDSLGPVVVRSPAPADPVEVPHAAVKPAALAAPAQPRSAVVEALTAPVTVESPRPASPLQPVIDALLRRPRQVAAVAGGLFVLCIVILLASFGGDDDAAAVFDTPRVADGILTTPGSSAVPADVSGKQVTVAAERGQQQVLVGGPDEAGTAIDAASVTASAAEPATPLNTADTGIAFDAAAVPVPLPVSRATAVRSAPRVPPSTAAPPASKPSMVAPSVSAPDNAPATSSTVAGTTIAASAEAKPAATGEATASNDSDVVTEFVGDYDPNGPVPFSALELAHYVEPVFPEAFSEQTIEGWVDVRFSIDTAGTVTELELLDTNLPPDFLPPSRAAVREWRFKPFVWNGIPLAASTTVRLTYSN